MVVRSLARCALAAGLLSVAGMANASGLQIAPVGLEFLPSIPAQGLWLTNTGADVLHAQVRVFHWTEAGGKDVLTPTRALVASPPMLELAPNSRQLVRVIRLDATDASGGEDAYRLLVDELPQPGRQKQTGVRYVLRYSIPVFVEPGKPPGADAVAAKLRWSLVRDGEGIALQLRNAGATHAQLSDVSLLPPGGTPIKVSSGLLGYALAGMTMRWPLQVSASRLPSGTRLKVAINGKPVEQAVAVGDLPR